MSTNVLRTADGWWAVRGERAVPVRTEAATTAELIADRAAVKEAAASGKQGTPVADLAALSPVTTPCRVVAQMVNYRSHARDSGFTGDIPPAFFRKASGSVSGPADAIVRPAHVALLDYEVELGLVMGAPLPVGTVVGEPDLPSYVAGLVVTDDVSARDVQLTRTQFYESKSYPTFTPTGPHLALLEPEDFAHLLDLRLRLSVNGELRQDRTLGTAAWASLLHTTRSPRPPGNPAEALAGNPAESLAGNPVGSLAGNPVENPAGNPVENPQGTLSRTPPRTPL
ncbi:fumarylacetoacetate hydrolase family protein [Streptomyces sp. NPDC090499]|uniref:fumarylacetoacetate hydrolase family protein n=1 Tax=Streptomyces sp. NPDC090499 TaxID=3365965 RepID=UPI00380AEA7F